MLQDSRQRKLPLQQCSNVAQNFQHHRVRKLSSKSILLAGMIRRKEPRQIAWQLITRAMPKRKRSQRRNQTALFQQSQISPHRDAPQDQHRARPQDLQIALQKVPAIRQLRGQRLVRRRRAAQSCGHIRILQRKPIFAIHGSSLIGKPRAKQGLVQKISRAIAGKHSPGAIPSMRRRRKPQN